MITDDATRPKALELEKLKKLLADRMLDVEVPNDAKEC